MTTPEAIVEAMLDPEKVVWAATRLPDGRVLKGRSHGNIRNNMSRHYKDEEEGFLTNRGRFVTREQAYALAIIAKQFTPKEYAQADVDLWGWPKREHAGIEALTFDVVKRNKKKP